MYCIFLGLPKTIERDLSPPGKTFQTAAGKFSPSAPVVESGGGNW